MFSTIAAIRINPSLTPDLLRCHLEIDGLRAVLLAGYGKGNGPDNLIPVIKEFAQKGIAFFMTTQCEHGAVNMGTYEAGDQYRRAGVIGLGNLHMNDALRELQIAARDCKTIVGIQRHMINAAAKAPEAGSFRNPTPLGLCAATL